MTDASQEQNMNQDITDGKLSVVLLASWSPVSRFTSFNCRHYFHQVWNMRFWTWNLVICSPQLWFNHSPSFSHESTTSAWRYVAVWETTPFMWSLLSDRYWHQHVETWQKRRRVSHLQHLGLCGTNCLLQHPPGLYQHPFNRFIINTNCMMKTVVRSRSRNTTNWCPFKELYGGCAAKIFIPGVIECLAEVSQYLILAVFPVQPCCLPVSVEHPTGSRTRWSQLLAQFYISTRSSGSHLCCGYSPGPGKKIF